MIRRLRTLACIAFATGTLVAASRAAAQSDAPCLHSGRRLYLQHCAACHGESGDGEGFLSTILSPPTTDLRKLSKDNDGQFPFYETMMVIDGRKTIRAHGHPMMPVWGKIFSHQSVPGEDPQDHAIIHGEIVLITEYIYSLQER